MSAIDNARAALVQGELNAEMGVPVSWAEVRALHGVIRELIADHKRAQAEILALGRACVQHIETANQADRGQQ